MCNDLHNNRRAFILMFMRVSAFFFLPEFQHKGASSLIAYLFVKICGVIHNSIILYLQEKPGAPALHLEPEEATVTFEDVTFSYTPEKTILEGLCFRAPAGKKLAIVGASGSG